MPRQFALRGHAEGGYEPVADAMFNALEVDGFFLEYDDARSGDFRPLRFVRREISASCSDRHLEIRHAREQGVIEARLDEAAKYMPFEQMCLSPQCGFASHTGGNILSEDEQYAKLRLVVELAAKLWPA